MKMNIPGQDEINDPVILDRMRADRQADLDFVFKSKNPNRKIASMGLDELRAAVVQANGGVVPDSESSRPLTAAQSSFLETGRQEKLARDALARAATSETMKSVEEHGYLYHYAPKDARESILEEGMRPSQARTAIGDIKGPMAHHATHVPENSLYFFTDPNYAPSAEMLFDGGRPDMYRVKIEPGMLDNMAVDPRLPIVGGRGSAVILPIKGDSILAELFAVDVEFDYGAESGTIKGRTFLSDSQRARVQPVVKAATHGEAVDPRSVAPVQKAKPQAVLPVTQQGKPVMNIPGHGQVIDPKTVSSSGAAKTQSTLKTGKQKTRWKPVYENGKLIGHQQTIDGVKKAYLPFDADVASMPRSPAYDAAFNVESTPGKSKLNIHFQNVEGPNQFRVKAGRTVEFGGKTYKGGQFVPTQAGLVDSIIGRASQGAKLFASEKSFLEENYPANFLDNELRKRIPSLPKQIKPSVTFQAGEQIRQDQEEARKAARLANGEQRIADRARNRESAQAVESAENLAKAERKTAERVQAVISRGSSEVGETIIPSRLAPAAEQAEEVVRKAPISRRTMEKMMSSNMLAAGVAAGGLGLLYASNKIRGEREVGR